MTTPDADPSRAHAFCPLCHGTGSLGYTLTDVGPCATCHGTGVIEPVPPLDTGIGLDYLDGISERVLGWLVIGLLLAVAAWVLAVCA